MMVFMLTTSILKTNALMTGQFLSGHVAVKQIEGKTFRPRRSSSVTILCINALMVRQPGWSVTKFIQSAITLFRKH